MPTRKGIVLEMPAVRKGGAPQPPDSPSAASRLRIPAGSVLEQNREQMFFRFRRNTLPRSLAATFETSESDVVAILNEQITARLKRAA